MKASLGFFVLSALSSACLACADGGDFSPFPREAPATPLVAFAAGRLGVLDPSFQRAYRVIAWRVLTDKPLGAAQAAQVKAAFADRPTQDWTAEDDLGQGVSSWGQALERYAPGARDKGAWVRASRIERIELPGGRIQLTTYSNCSADATVTAARTLSARARAYGTAAENRWVAEWVRGQQQVFENCESGVHRLEPAPPEAPAWFRQDRAYQQAAAHFYAGRLEPAREAFESVARDTASPWSVSAPYLAARALLRQGSLSESADERRRLLGSALERFERLAASGPNALRASAARLAQRVRIELDPQAQLGRLDRLVGVEPWGPDATGQLEDYLTLLRKTSAPESGTRGATASLVAARGGAADWVSEFDNALSVDPASDTQSGVPDTASGAPRACKEAREKPGHRAWATLCYMQAASAQDIAPGVQRFAETLAPQDPAYATVSYNRLRLRLQALREETGTASGAPAQSVQAETANLRQALDIELRRGAAVYGVEGLNALRILRARLSLGAADFLRHVRVQPMEVAQTYGWMHEVGRDVTSGEPVEHELVNELYLLPVSKLAALAQDTELPVAWQNTFADVALVRAALLGQHDRARELAQLVQTRQPREGSELPELLQARDEVSRNYILARFMGHAHGHVAPRFGAGPEFGWLTAAERAIAARELERLERLEQDFFARSVLAYARTTPNDARLAVNLAEVVRGNRGELSRQAFVLLHRLFPKSDAARRTRYWY